MHIVNHCVGCGSSHITKKIAMFAPYIAHKVFDYVTGHVSVAGGPPSLPGLFTNSITCEQCGFVFSQLRFDSDEMNRIYRGYRSAEYVRVRELYEPGYGLLNAKMVEPEIEAGNRQLSMQHFLDGLIQAAQTQAVLDFGGDKGQHIPTMFSHCQRYVYDISNLNSVDGVTITNDLSSIGKVDFVMASNVLEHLPYPGKALDEIRRVCDADTLVFVDVPLEMNDSPVVDHDKTPMLFHEHCNYFNSRSLTAMMKAHGFTPLKLAVLNVDFGWASGNQIFIAAKLS